jgi:hypothetical protein
MYQEKVDRILVVNSYLTRCKMRNPNSSISRITQKYLTQQINQTLNGNNVQKIYNLFTPLLSFLFFK